MTVPRYVICAATLLALSGSCRSIESRLDTPVTVRFDSTPLVNALRELSRQSGISIELDRSAEDKKPTPITLRFDRLPCKYALAWVLRVAGPGHLMHRHSDRFTEAQEGALISLVEHDRVIVVSGREFLRRQPKIIRSYCLDDICADPDEANTLMEFITATFAPGTWEDMDSPNPAWVRVRSGKLVVAHWEHVQEEVGAFLDSLRRSAHPAEPDAELRDAMK